MTTKTKAREQVGLAVTGGAIAYYARLGAMTSAGKHAAMLVPGDRLQLDNAGQQGFRLSAGASQPNPTTRTSP